MIFEKPQRILSQLHKTLLETIRRERGSCSVTRSIERMYTRHHEPLAGHRRRIFEQAAKISDSVLDLLGLK